MMKKTLIILVLFFPTLLCAQNLAPLSENIDENDLSDPAFSLYLVERCASFFKSEYEIYESASTEISDKALTMATDLLDIGISSLSKIENMSSEKAEKIMTETINTISELYIEDFEDNMTRTGSYFENSYLKEENSICVDLFKNFKDFSNWIITPVEFQEIENKKDYYEEVSFTSLLNGPRIEIIKPAALSKISSPLHIKIIFHDSEYGYPADMKSLKVTYHSFIKKNLTKKINKYLSLNVLDYPKAKLPKGEHEIELYIEDTEGNITNRMMQILVIKNK